MIVAEQQVQELIPWPYVIRRSARAKSLRISVSREHGVEVVYPRWSSRKVALQFLLESRPWLNKHQKVLNHSLIAAQQLIPTGIDLMLLKFQYEVNVNVVDGAKVILRSDKQRLFFSGDVKDLTCVAPLLKRWLFSLAKKHLTPRVRKISAEIGLPFARLSWRLQKTLWGSCSAKNNISLNVKLLFVADDLFRYVVIHELSHTHYRSHGPRFWALVRRLNPDFRHHEHGLKQVLSQLPLWLSHL
jgi:predicted metal-dependent hydrolase